MPFLSISLADALVLLGGAATAVATLGALAYGLMRYVLRGIREIARNEIAPQHALLSQVVEQNGMMLTHIEAIESRVGALNLDVAKLQGWQAGFTTGTHTQITDRSP